MLTIYCSSHDRMFWGLAARRREVRRAAVAAARRAGKRFAQVVSVEVDGRQRILAVLEVPV